MRRDLFPDIPQIKGLFRYLVLYVLKDESLHGYGIMQRISDLIGWGYTPSPGIIYPTLQLLEDLDYVYSEKEGRKTVYHITDKGREALEERREDIDGFLKKIGRMHRLFEELGGDEIYQAIKKIITNYPFLSEKIKSMIREEAHRFRVNIENILRGGKYDE